MAIVHTVSESVPRIDRGEELRRGFAAARELCRTDPREFQLASFFLPRRKRDAVHAVWAFCRMIVEAIDVPEDAPLVGSTVRRTHPAISLPQIEEEKASGGCALDQVETRLQLLSDRLDEIFEDRLELPALESRSPQQHSLAAFARVARQFEIDKQYFLDFAHGCRLAMKTRRTASFESFEEHCRLIGGAVGLMMSCVLGLQHSDAKRQAAAMGSGIRLTSILRDAATNPEQSQIDRARQWLAEGAAGICWLAGDGSRLVASLLAVVHAETLDTIGFPHRITMTTARQIAQLPRAWRLARRLSHEPMPNLFRR